MISKFKGIIVDKALLCLAAPADRRGPRVMKNKGAADCLRSNTVRPAHFVFRALLALCASPRYTKPAEGLGAGFMCKDSDSRSHGTPGTAARRSELARGR